MAIGNRVSAASGPSTQSRKLWESFRRHVFVLVKMAYERLPAANFQAAEEPDITGELAREVEEILEEANAPEWMEHFDVHDDPPQNTTHRKGKYRPRIDLYIVRTQRGKRPRFYFEAKRLSKGKTYLGTFQSKKTYLGQEGLGMFINGIYAPNSREAGMLGYVQTGTVAEWHKDCQQRLGKIECVPVKLADDLEVFHSIHKRKAIGMIDIYHLFLVFR